MRVLALLGLVGCWSNAQPAWTPPEQAAEVTMQCPIRLSDDGHVFVWEADLGVMVTKTEKREIAIYPLGDQALVSYRLPADVKSEPRGGDVVWRVSCDGKKLDSLVVDGADFGHAALHPDRRRLFYSAGSVAVLDLATKKSSPITKPPKAICGDPEVQLRDVVRGATRDHVEFERGGLCGFDREYQATAMRRHVALGREEKATPITGIVSVDREVWIAAGECGNAAIYRSSDWRTWKKVEAVVQGRITLVASRGAVVMATGLCSGTAGGNPARITRDHGATWTSVSKATVVEWVDGDALGSLRAGAANGREMRWKDGVLVETAVAWKQAPAFPPPTTIDGRTVRPTLFGLYQGDERLFPR